MRAASGLEVLTGLGLVVAPSLLSRLLFGSDLNAAGEATGRIAGLVMLCLAAGLLAARRRRRGSCARPAHGSELARGGLPHRYRLYRSERRSVALACRRASRDFGGPAYARLDGKPALGGMTKRREAKALWQDSGAARRVERPGRVGED